MRKLLWVLVGAFAVAGPLTAAAQDLSCAHWCNLLSSNCGGEVVHDEDFCLSYCQPPLLDIVPTGTEGDSTGNSLACRIHHAEAAGVTSGATRDAHCAAAAMSGGNICGSFCDVYCHVALETCNRTENPVYTGTELFLVSGVPNITRCRAACRDYPEEVLDGISQTDQLFGYGDTVQCRLHHLQAAVVEGQDQTSAYGLHCGHASPEAANDLCSDIAEPNMINYCVFALHHCTDENALFAEDVEHSDCVSEMALLVNDGTYRQDGFASFTDEGTNSVGCLNNRIMLAAQDAPTYCAAGDYDPDHWVPDGSAVCAAENAAVPTGSGLPMVLAGWLTLAGLFLLWRRTRSGPRSV